MYLKVKLFKLKQLNSYSLRMMIVRNVLMLLGVSMMGVVVKAMTIDEMMVEVANTSGEGLQHSYFEDNSTIVVELDIKYKRQDWEQMKNSRRKRHAPRLQTTRWTNKTIPYIITPKPLFNSINIQEIENAIDEWKNYTCVHFRPRTEADENYVTFENGRHCLSYIGMQGKKQSIELHPACRKKAIIVHEIGHVLGLHHEHMRPDRDDYVTINRANVIPGFLNNFEKDSRNDVTAYGIPYDYTSSMHYGKKYFSSNGRPTMIAKRAKYTDLMGTSLGASFRDIKLVNFMYHCNEDCPPKSCPGEGFVGKDCQCWCPDNSTAGRPAIRCADTENEPSCLIPGEPDHKSSNCLYQYIKYLERRDAARISSLQNQLSSLKDQMEVLKNAPSSPPKDCSDLYRIGARQDKVYTVYPRTIVEPVQVFCILKDVPRMGGGWTTIQSRVDGSVNFNRSWHGYKHGFGSPTGNYWIGNRNLAALTKYKTYKLLVLLKDWEGEGKVALYSVFRIGNESDFYRLNVSGYQVDAGDRRYAGDSMTWHNGARFSTYDNDHDTNSGENCAKDYGSGFWFKSCFKANLNGNYQRSSTAPGIPDADHPRGVMWFAWHGVRYSLKGCLMLIKPADM